MTRRIILGIFVALVLIGGAVGVGALAYNYGVAQGLAQSGQLAEGVAPFMRPHMGFGYGMPFGFGWRPFGFGFLGLLFPLFGFLFLVWLISRLFWRPWGWRGGWGGHGPQGHSHEGLPPMFEEWHRRAHGESAPSPSEPSNPQPPSAG